MSAKKRPVRERGRPIWVTAPVGRQLDELQSARIKELGRTVTMAEVIEQLLLRSEDLDLLAAHIKVVQP